MPSPMNALVLQQNHKRKVSEWPVNFQNKFPKRQIVTEEQVLTSPCGQTLYRCFSMEQISFTSEESSSVVKLLRHCFSEIHISDNREYDTWGLTCDSQTDKGVKKDSNMEAAPVRSCNSSQNSNVEKASKVSENSHSVLRSGFLFLLLSFILLILLACHVTLYQRSCQLPFNMSFVKSTLDEKVFGQENATDVIVTALETFYTSLEPGLVTFIVTGPTGIGKSHTMSVLEELFPWQKNVRHWITPLNSADANYHDKMFSVCGDNLFVVDDLADDDVNEAIDLAKYLTVISESKRILLFLVFNLHKALSEQYPYDQLVTKSMTLENKFASAGLEINMVSFKRLEKQHVSLCIKEAIAKLGIASSEENIAAVLKNVVPSQEGCKRVASKTALLLDNTKTEL